MEPRGGTRGPVGAPSEADLSPREREALRHVAQGFTHAQGTRRMQITRGTFDTYIKRVRRKIGSGNKGQLVRQALELGLIEHEGAGVISRDPSSDAYVSASPAT